MWPLWFRNFIVRHVKGVFVFYSAANVVAVFFFLPYKIALLNLFYLPVLSAAYFFGKRKIMLLAVLFLLSGPLFAYYKPAEFAVGGTRLEAILEVSAWGGFLILVGAWSGALQERLTRAFEANRQLLKAYRQLCEANRQLCEELKRCRKAPGVIEDTKQPEPSDSP
jgi:hypothetical protein